MGAGGLEPPEPEGEGFTVPCNCRYATPPTKKGREICWRKDLNPQPSDYKSGALPIELLQRIFVTFYNKTLLCEQGFIYLVSCVIEEFSDVETLPTMEEIAVLSAV